LRDARQTVESQASAFELVLTGDSTAVAAARDRIMDFLEEQGVGDEEAIDILVALQEAFANAVLHGCQNDPSKIIRCSVDVDGEAVTIVIKDPGEGFDTSAATDVSDDGINLTNHGRGIFLMRGLMDEVSYSHGGSEIRLKKLRRAGQ
jgi:anti-sigma regulatory factor (Ser/Thr protein kinase)